MKKGLFALAILSIICITSCSKDDEPEIEAGLTGTLTFDGSEITVTDGLFGEATEEGEYAATFFLSDGTITFDAEAEQAGFQGDYLINVIIYSESDAFVPGNYNVASLDSEVADKTAFVVFADVDNAGDGGGIAIGGTVNIQGSGNSYTLTFAVDFEDDVELVGNASGSFEIITIEL